ncbi:transcriptional regulator domain-containing protein [Hephaestia caeni]|uniref:transcriptional regulator domain-containing protein n=1 Tax=Hephaestia caeni TaxID=645617 RepID=UPI000E5C1271
MSMLRVLSMGYAMNNGRGTNANRRADLDFAGFAQEFLRRNPDYVRDYRIIHDAPPDGQEVMARIWGLCFPVSAGSAARRCAGVVARHPVSRHRHSRCSAARLR